MEAAVLYITFARPEYARLSFEGIKRIKPKKLYFYSNKARSDRFEEVEKNNEIRNYVHEVDWDCELKTFFRDDYVDVYTSLLSAFSWAFSHEEKVITAEEDVVLTPAFWSYCNALLDKYQNDSRIWMISGDNYADGYNPKGTDYHFSTYCLSHGWGTWRDRWEKINWDKLDVDAIISNKILEGYFHSKKEILFHKKRLKHDEQFVNSTKCWDYFFFYTGVMNGALSIIPAYHLIKNVGKDGVHSKSRIKDVAYQDVSWKKDNYPLNSPPRYFVADVDIDKKIFDNCFFKNTRLYRKILNKIMQYL